MAYLYVSHLLTLLGPDCLKVSGWLKPEMEIIWRSGYNDTAKWTVKFIARVWSPEKQHDELGLLATTYLTHEGRLFTHIRGKSKKTLREVGRLVYHKQLDPAELAAYLKSISAEKPEMVLEPEIEY